MRSLQYLPWPCSPVTLLKTRPNNYLQPRINHGHRDSAGPDLSWARNTKWYENVLKVHTFVAGRRRRFHHKSCWRAALDVISCSGRGLQMGPLIDWWLSCASCDTHSSSPHPPDIIMTRLTPPGHLTTPASSLPDAWYRSVPGHITPIITARQLLEVTRIHSIINNVLLLTLTFLHLVKPYLKIHLMVTKAVCYISS